ncbi:substrate-binding periplasmic protein [Marinomonas pollencensis]|uniref:Amino acid ABC transporter substrate-binding protein (PAAT family) n=1 Tax=Marinomonas pollencensis TaxID=491954 RepID=A0A3E0DVQ9_9GAMM|nr:transporter substrate-binding domain-containing protein [Marinomonas pollencensis]REG86925.1 amino acid ABC transporter substrate-binding protein (PAAT family) [Marinomonas pollencensis]
MGLQKALALCFITSAFVSSFSQAANSESHNQAVCTSLTATGNLEYPPFLWRVGDAKRQLLGANRLIIDELSRRIQIPIVLEDVGPWSNALSYVKGGKVDIMAGAFYTNKRASYMDYFYPVMLHTTSVIWQRKDKRFPFYAKEDLQGKWGATLMSNSFGQAFDRFAQEKLNILSVASVATAFQMLMADDVDYVLYEKNPGIAYVSMLGLDNKVEMVQPFVSSEGLYLTLSKASPCNTPEIKRKIALALYDIHKQGFAEQALLEGVKEWQQSRLKSMALLNLGASQHDH